MGHGGARPNSGIKVGQDGGGQRLSAWVPADLLDRFLDRAEHEGMSTRSEAVVEALRRFLGEAGIWR